MGGDLITKITTTSQQDFKICWLVAYITFLLFLGTIQMASACEHYSRVAILINQTLLYLPHERCVLRDLFYQKPPK